MKLANWGSPCYEEEATSACVWWCPFANSCTVCPWPEVFEMSIFLLLANDEKSATKFEYVLKVLMGTLKLLSDHPNL